MIMLDINICLVGSYFICTFSRTHSGLSAPRHPLVESGHPADNNKPAKPAPKRPLETQKDDVSPACVSAPKKAKMDEHRLSDKVAHRQVL